MKARLKKINKWLDVPRHRLLLAALISVPVLFAVCCVINSAIRSPHSGASYSSPEGSATPAPSPASVPAFEGLPPSVNYSSTCRALSEHIVEGPSRFNPAKPAELVVHTASRFSTSPDKLQIWDESRCIDVNLKSELPGSVDRGFSASAPPAGEHSYIALVTTNEAHPVVVVRDDGKVMTEEIALKQALGVKPGLSWRFFGWADSQHMVIDVQSEEMSTTNPDTPAARQYWYNPEENYILDKSPPAYR